MLTSKRSTGRGLLLGLAVAGVVVIASITLAPRTGGPPAEPRPAEPPSSPVVEKELRSVPLPAPRATGSLPLVRDAIGLRRPLRSRFVYTAPAYRGPLDPPSIEELVRTGRAECLEPRLADEHRARLRQHTRGLDHALELLGRQHSERARAIREKLARDPTRSIRIHAPRRELDPAYRKVLELESKIGNRGAVWGGFDERGLYYVVVRWREWPKMKELVDSEHAVVHQRALRVREWITREYARHGLGLFAPRTPGGRAAPSHTTARARTSAPGRR